MDSVTRKRALDALKAGLLTFDEVVALTEVARSTVWRWCRAEGIDWRAARWRHASAEWKSLTKGRERRQAKHKQRRVAELSTGDYLRRGGTIKRAER